MSNPEIARTFFDRMERGDTSDLLALVAPDAEFNLVPLNLRGKAAEVGTEYLRQLKNAFPDLQLRVNRLFVGNDGTAVAEVTLAGTQAADFFGIINQEKLMDLEQVWLLHLSGDKIDGARAYWCQNKLYRRLGVKRLDRVTITA
jgi:ketosteroid isomerase-like protein